MPHIVAIDHCLASLLYSSDGTDLGAGVSSDRPRCRRDDALCFPSKFMHNWLQDISCRLPSNYAFAGAGNIGRQQSLEGDAEMGDGVRMAS